MSEIHDSLGGSNAHIWGPGRCSLSPALSAQFPRVVNEHMEAGTKRHDRLSNALRNKAGAKDDLTPEDIASILRMEKERDQVLGTSKRVVESIELYYGWPGYGGIMGGTPDYFTMNENGLVFLSDWKNFDITGAEEQLTFYACLIFKNHEASRKLNPKLPEITSIVAVCLPLEGSPKVLGFDTMTLEFLAEEFEAAADMFLNDPIAKTGPWCERCNGKAGCVAFNEKITSDVNLIKEQAAKLPVLKEGRKLTPDVAKLPDDVLARLLHARKDIYSMLEAVEAYAKQKAMELKPIMDEAGKFVLKPGNRVRVFVANAKEEFAKLGITDVTEEKMKGLGELDKRCPGGKVPEHITTLRQNNPSLVYRSADEPDPIDEDF